MDARFSKKGVFLFLISVTAVLLHASGVASGLQCPSSKSSRKAQEALLKKLEPHNVVAEATYMGELNGTYRFQIAQIWEKNNGGLKRYSYISADAKPQLVPCFRKLKFDDDYILMLSAVDADHQEYTAIAPPVASKREKHRQVVWEQLCSAGNSDCAMRITFPPSTIFYRGTYNLLQCKVESSSEVQQVTWFKDGSNVDSTMHRMTGLIVQSYSKSNSFIIIKGASHVHNGHYECVGRNAQGQTATGTTEVRVIGPESETHFKPCKDPTYCTRGGSCKQFVDNAVKPTCECPPGTTGERCDENVYDITASSSIDKEDIEKMQNELSQLNTTIAVVTISLVCVILVCLMYIVKLRRRLSPNEDTYDAVNQSCSDSERSKTDIEARRYTSSGTETTSVRLSVVETLDRPNSSRSSYASPRTSSNSQFFTVSHEQNGNKLSSDSSAKDIQTKSPGSDSIHRHSSVASDDVQRRGRLYAKS